MQSDVTSVDQKIQSKLCRFCSSPFTAVSSNGQLYCKEQCRIDYHRICRPVRFVCPSCGSEYVRRFYNVAKGVIDSLIASPAKCRKCKAGNRVHPMLTASEYFTSNTMATWRFSAKRRGHIWELTKEQLDEKLKSQNGICALSGVEFQDVRRVQKSRNPYRPSIDRIDSKIGYVPGNFQFVCSIVNIMKNRLDETEFIRMCGLISKHRSNSE